MLGHILDYSIGILCIIFAIAIIITPLSKEKEEEIENDE